MRNPKFKSWDTEKEYWIESFFINPDNGAVCQWDNLERDYIENENAKLIRYTDTTDKNGSGIYEGDIVREYGRTGIATVTAPIVYYKNGFYLDDFLYSNWSAEYVEVIGNIYQNKDLLNDSDGGKK